jgi:hypothetical protein
VAASWIVRVIVMPKTLQLGVHSKSRGWLADPLHDELAAN